MPQRSASSRRNCPEGALPSTSAGIWSRRMPLAASSEGDQSRAATSSQLVPEASDISPTRSPVSQSRR